tara:strand:- start:1 stop:246 length:246 start_codon:yes stop_codon:yes gene_type:complete
MPELQALKALTDDNQQGLDQKADQNVTALSPECGRHHRTASTFISATSADPGRVAAHRWIRPFEFRSRPETGAHRSCSTTP